MEDELLTLKKYMNTTAESENLITYKSLIPSRFSLAIYSHIRKSVLIVQLKP